MRAQTAFSRRTLIGAAAAVAGSAVLTESARAAKASSAIIDVHAHAILPVWRQALEAKMKVAPGAAAVAGMKLPDWTPEGHIEFMDRNGIAAGILSWPDAASVTRGKPAQALARAVNEEFAAIVAKFPKRFGAFAVLPLDDIEAANAEMSYALDTLKLDGISSPAQFEGAYLGENRYEPWFAEMNRRKATLFVHPGVPRGMEQVYVGPNPSTLEFMFDTTRMVTKLLLSGFKSRFADINIISTHGGGTIPYLAHRLAISVPFFGTGADRPAMSGDEALKLLGSFYYDLTASTSPAQLAAITQLVPASRLMMGFDFPMMPAAMAAPEIAAFEASTLFDAAGREQVRSGTALRLFPRLAHSLAA